jgi:hypothetical protein
MVNDIIFALIIIAAICLFIVWFLKLGKERQLKIINEWLLLAVVKAEKELGDGTGQIKLRFVYDLFIDKFKFASMFISFNQFSILVDSALVIMKEMVSNNDQVKNYIVNK